MPDNETKPTAVEDPSVDDRLDGKAMDVRDIALAVEFNSAIRRMFPGETKISTTVIAVATATIIEGYVGQIEPKEARQAWIEQYFAGIRARLGISRLS